MSDPDDATWLEEGDNAGWRQPDHEYNEHRRQAGYESGLSWQRFSHLPGDTMTTSRPVDIVLNSAADLIEERGWHQGDWTSPTGAMTIEAAIWHATWGTYNLRRQLMARAHSEAWQRMSDRSYRQQQLSHWNNSPETNVDMVLDLLRDKPIPPKHRHVDVP